MVYDSYNHKLHKTSKEGMNTDLQIQVRNAIENIVDPDLERTFGKLHTVHNVEIDDSEINVYIELVPPINWIAKAVDQTIKDVVSALAPKYKVTVHVREKEIPRSGNKSIIPQVKNMIAVASGKGGVGKSTIAANLACALSLGGAKVGLLDADIYGPSAPTMFGLTGVTMQAEKTADGRILGSPNMQYGIEIASIGFVMQRDQAAILRGPMLAGYFKTLVDQILWSDLDFLIFDLPPGTGDIQLTLTQQIPLTGAVIVTTPQEIALADVRRSIAMFRKVQVDILGVVENMSYFTPPDAPEKKYHIFGEGGGKLVADEAGVHLLGEVPINLMLRIGGDDGLPAVLNPDTDFNIVETIKNIAAQVVKETRFVNAKRLETPVIQITL